MNKKIVVEKKKKEDILTTIDNLIKHYTYNQDIPAEWIKGKIIGDLARLYFDVCGIDENQNSDKELIETIRTKKKNYENV